MIIGLGGLGSEVVENIYRKFIAGNPSQLETENVVFLCLDTDENDIKDRLKVMPAASVIKTSSSLSSTIGQYIEAIRGKVNVMDWFDTKSKELNSMALNDGAAQVRMASRLAMISAIDQGKLTAIDNGIKQLMATDPNRKEGNNIRIHIITSLAGGTGAGTFLQTAYYVKNAMRKEGALAPKIYGYFVLPDTISEGSKTFDKTQTTNVQSNAYACMKELLAFSSGNKGLKAIDFQYRIDQRDISLPADRPYDECFIMDFNGANGGNLQLLNRYKEQMASFVFLIVFGKTGDDFRKKAINNIRDRIKADGTNMYASFGVSKLVYPVDDLFAYFARQSVNDHMSTTWCQIDKDIKQRFDEYDKNVFHGIPDTQPDKGEEFMRHVMNYKNGAGHIAAQFKQIYNSTQVLNDDMNPIGTKAQEYLKEVTGFVESTLNSNRELTELYDICTVPNANFTQRDSPNDLNFVVQRERELEDYRKAVMSAIDGSKQFVIRECFIVDRDAENYVSRTPASHRHHLNTFILEKDHEMHPIAVRYFLYEIKDLITGILEGSEGKKEANRQLRDLIEKEYKEQFDIKETANRTETPADYVKDAKQKSEGLINRASKIISGQSPYKAAKENYVSKSRQQAENIRQYAYDKLLEEVLAGLLDQINLLIEESETFFENLPAALEAVDNERVNLLKKHNSVNSDHSVEYVLASEQMKKLLYDSVLNKSQAAFFPTKLSASIYRTMFDNVVNILDNEGFVTLAQDDLDARKEAAIESNKTIIEECILYQDKYLREKNSHLVNMNVVSALLEEAQRTKGKAEKDWKPYVKERFRIFRDRAEIWGPSHLNSDVRYINSWGFNRKCLSAGTIDANFANELFGDTDVATNEMNAASRLESDFFSPYEIVRCNTVTLLYIDKFFPKFTLQSATGMTDEFMGDYRKSYDDVVKEMMKEDSKTYSPHLNKHWHLPAYMPNIGSTMAEEKKKLFRAFYGGLLFDKFKAAYDSAAGENYWKYQGKTWKFIKQEDGRRVPIGNGQIDALNNLFAKGLTNNPDMVEQINEFVDAQWAEAREQWLGADRDETNMLQKMKELDIVKRILEFKFNIHSSFAKDQNWFTLLNSRKGMILFDVIEEHKDFFFEDLFDRLIGVFSPGPMSKKLIQAVLKVIKKEEVKADSLSILQDYENNDRFEPVDE